MQPSTSLSELSHTISLHIEQSGGFVLNSKFILAPDVRFFCAILGKMDDLYDHSMDI